MALNAEQTFSLDLSLFGGKVSGIAAANLAAGVSPDCADVFFLPQQVATRPAFLQAFTSSLGDVNVMSHAPYNSPDGAKYIIALDSAGNVNEYSAQTGTNSVLGHAQVGCRFSSAQAFSKFFMAFFDVDDAQNFSDSPFVGTDIPKYINSLGVLSRVTVDGPGGGFSVQNNNLSSFTVSSMARLNNIVTAVLTSNPGIIQEGWFLNPVDSQGTPGQVPGGTAGEGPVESVNQTEAVGNIESIIILSSGPTSTSSGNVLTVFYNRSDLPGAPDYGLINAFATGPIDITLANLEQYGLTSGTYPCVAASASYVTPPGGDHNWYYFSVTYGSSGAVDTGFTIPQNTTATYQYGAPLSNAANELFQSLGNVTLVGDGLGNIHVTDPTGIVNLPVGAWLYLYIEPPTPANITEWEQGEDTGSIQVPGTNWAVGTTILINGFQAGTPQQPTWWNGQTVTIIGASGDFYTFSWPSASTSSGLAVANGGTAVPTNSFYPSQWIQVSAIIEQSSGSVTIFSYYAQGNTQTTPISGTLYDYFGSLNSQLSLTPPLPGQTSLPTSAAQNVAQGFQIISITGNTVTWYQPGPNDTYDGGHVIILQPQTAVAPGPRSAFCFFINQDGGASPGGPPIQFSTNGGGDYPEFTIPVGPPGTIARGIGVTPAYGADYFTLPKALQIAAAGPIVTPGIIIQDNTTLQVTLDWSDAALVDSIPVSGEQAVGSDFGDLTSTVTLSPCLGVIPYNQMLAWYGEINSTKNLLNMSMQGGVSLPLSSPFSDSQPLGWNTLKEYNGITPDETGRVQFATDGSGWVYQMGGSSGDNSMISQGAYQDVWGAPILLPNVTYLMRFRGQAIAGTQTGQINFVLYSPSKGVLASCSKTCSSFTSSLAWWTLDFSAAMPQSIPSDTVLYVTLSGVTNNGVIAIADLLLINGNQPVLQNQVRFSYVDNEFGYDNENGFIVGFSTSDSMTSAFVQRQYLYLVSENDLFSTAAQNSVPADWPADKMADDCGGSGPNATAGLQDLQWWVGRQGVQVFNGTQPKKISQEVQPDFDQTNWNYIVNTSMAHDALQRVLYIAIPTGAFQSPNVIQSMNHRMADPAINVMDPVHISQYTGKMIATDLARKWTPIRRSMNSLSNCWVNESGTIQRVMTFAGGSGDYGQVYYQDFSNYPPTNPSALSWNYTDADMGEFTSYYTTYFFFAHDIEQNALLALYRKLFAYMSFHVIGEGDLGIVPYVDSMSTVWPALPTWTLQLTDPGIDYETPLNITGNRAAFQFSVTAGAFQLTHMIVSARRDLVFPVRGAF